MPRLAPAQPKPQAMKWAGRTPESGGGAVWPRAVSRSGRSDRSRDGRRQHAAVGRDDRHRRQPSGRACRSGQASAASAGAFARRRWHPGRRRCRNTQFVAVAAGGSPVPRPRRAAAGRRRRSVGRTTGGRDAGGCDQDVPGRREPVGNVDGALASPRRACPAPPELKADAGRRGRARGRPAAKTRRWAGPSGSRPGVRDIQVVAGGPRCAARALPAGTSPKTVTHRVSGPRVVSPPMAFRRRSDRRTRKNRAQKRRSGFVNRRQCQCQRRPARLAPIAADVGEIDGQVFQPGSGIGVGQEMVAGHQHVRGSRPVPCPATDRAAHNRRRRRARRWVPDG